MIFDLDGTISDSLPVHIETWNMVGKKYGFVFDPKIIFELTGRPTIEFAKCIIERENVNEDPEVLVRLKHEAFWECAHKLIPIEEVTSIVKEYHGKLPMAIGTGASRKSAETQLKALDLSQYFDIIISANEVNKHKPEPDTFLECARQMNVEPKFCQVFEDGDLGITAAKTAGMFITDVRPHIKYGEWARS